MTLNLQNVKFAVQPAGREKVRREGKKNVHAFVRGTVIMGEFTETFKDKCEQVIQYNPYQDEQFSTYLVDPETRYTTYSPVYKASLVSLTQGTVYAAL